MTVDEIFISACIELAKRGIGYVSPNPLVGCIIVKGDAIIGDGYHTEFGSHHAEVNAINSSLSKGIDIEGSTLYVNLEPCAHYGKRPPCVDIIIQHKIAKVVIGTIDSHNLVSGRGIKKLNDAGIEVIVGVLEDECNELNKYFFKNAKTGLPYVTLKAAQTLDGKIADTNFESKWITSFESRLMVHKLRSQVDAVLVGRNTAQHDNPKLTVRHVEGRNPFRIVIDKALKLNLKLNLFSDKYKDKTIVLTTFKANRKKAKELENRNVKVIECKFKNDKIDLKDALKKLAKINIASILVEGGAHTYTEFLNNKLVDELLIFTAPKTMGKGIATFSNKIDFSKSNKITHKQIGKDSITVIKLN